MEKKKIGVKIDGRDYNVGSGKTILEACKEVGIKIPSLCYLKDVSHNASCAICVVDVKGAKSMVRSCVTSVGEGMEITTHSPAINQARKLNLELILANHPKECLICERNGNCELQTLCADLGMTETAYPRTKPNEAMDETSLSLVRNPDKCILCGRCIAVCADVQTF